ncbi:MAG: bifunctional 4-hydroxy-2-oxoglutarate aldolase/2-dehydro-3-deoxy-phosphogluconate aldolase [Kiritimatiellaeota bacterium]|nr:bifunctional 4-hydroxy-2-oxoglutarate aldolase/2-dehydro-3-deoxy-phosphogluconate aldolase [Kiritimatiellota bacterium]
MFARLSETGVVPILTVEDVQAGLRACEALLAGGLSVAEITFRTEAAAEAIASAAARFPDLLLGAGTLITPDDVRRAVDAGARFAVAPGCSRRVIEAALEFGLPLAPGVCTPSDIERALEYDLLYLKFFPGEAMGGVGTLKALAGPYGHLGVRFIPTGGVNIENMRTYLGLPHVAFVAGSWIARKDMIRVGEWGSITRSAKEALEVVRATRCV